MKCPYCGSRNTHVYGGYRIGDTYRRYRKCLECRRNFRTVEYVVLDVKRGRRGKEVKRMATIDDVKDHRQWLIAEGDGWCLLYSRTFGGPILGLDIPDADGKVIRNGVWIYQPKLLYEIRDALNKYLK